MYILEYIPSWQQPRILYRLNYLGTKMKMNKRYSDDAGIFL